MDFESELARLLEPIAPDAPCGESLEDSPALAALDAYRIFGLLTAPQNEPDWRVLSSVALKVLTRSKDFRVLAHLAAAVAHTGPLDEALQLFPVIELWLERYWDEVYPRIDSDSIMRRNALGDFADRVAVLDGLRRLPLIVHPQLGSFSLRDIDIATGAQPNPDPETTPRAPNEVAAAIANADPQPLAKISELAVNARKALQNSQDIMRARGGSSNATPQLEPVIALLARIQQVVSPRLAAAGTEARASADTPASEPGSNVAAAAAGGDSVKSRQDAIRALDAVANYFRRNEPSSPVPLIVERAKRMVTMDFLEVIADLAPDALESARKAAGVRAE